MSNADRMSSGPYVQGVVDGEVPRSSGSGGGGKTADAGSIVMCDGDGNPVGPTSAFVVGAGGSSRGVAMAVNQMPIAANPMAMLERALASGAGIEIVEKMMALAERWEANQARKAYDNAMASAKAEMPTITKNREVDFTSAKGRTHYKHEDLAEITKTVEPVLSKFGLYHRFRTTSPPGEPIQVTCIISHRDGYFEENTLSAGRDDSGGKNPIQQIGSTLTYLQRMTLKAALGLAAAHDDDGRGSHASTAGGAGGDPGPAAGVITQAQADELLQLIEDVGAKTDAFCKIFQVASVALLPAGRYAEATLRLKQYGKTQAAAKAARRDADGDKTK